MVTYTKWTLQDIDKASSRLYQTAYLTAYIILFVHMLLMGVILFLFRPLGILKTWVMFLDKSKRRKELREIQAIEGEIAKLKEEWNALIRMIKDAL